MAPTSDITVHVKYIIVFSLILYQKKSFLKLAAAKKIPQFLSLTSNKVNHLSQGQKILTQLESAWPKEFQGSFRGT